MLKLKCPHLVTLILLPEGWFSEMLVQTDCLNLHKSTNILGSLLPKDRTSWDTQDRSPNLQFHSKWWLFESHNNIIHGGRALRGMNSEIQKQTTLENTIRGSRQVTRR